MCFYSGVHLQLDFYSEAVKKLCGSAAIQNQKVNMDFVGFVFQKHLSYLTALELMGTE